MNRSIEMLPSVKISRTTLFDTDASISGERTDIDVTVAGTYAGSISLDYPEDLIILRDALDNYIIANNIKPSEINDNENEN